MKELNQGSHTPATNVRPGSPEEAGSALPDVGSASAVAEAELSGALVVISANPAMAELLGFATAEDLVGSDTEGWTPPSGGRRAAVTQQLAQKFFREGRPFGCVRVCRRLDGQEITLAVRSRGTLGPSGELESVWVSCVRVAEEPPPAGSPGECILMNAELTESLVSLELAHLRQAALARLGAVAVAATHPAEVLHVAINLLAEHLDVPLVKVLEHDPAREVLVVRAALGFVPDPIGREVSADIASQTGLAWTSAGAVSVAELPEEHRFSAQTRYEEQGARSGVAVPILGRSQRWGVIEVQDRVVRSFGADDIDFLRAVANIVGEHIARSAAERESVVLGEIVEHAPLLVGRFDPSGKLQYLNASARVAFGLGSAQDLRTTPVEALIRSVPTGSILQDLSGRAGDAGRFTAPSDFECKRQNGESFIATLAIHAQTGPDGGICSFAFLGLDITERMHSRRALEASLAEARSLAAHLDTVREEQARHFALELHDDLGQTLSAAKLAIHAMGGGTASQLPLRTASALAVLDQALQSVRRISHRMRPLQLESGRLDEALRALCASHEAVPTTTVRCSVAGAVERVDAGVALGLFRVAQEALSNATRHGRASTIEVRLGVEPGGAVSFMVSDDGAGFDVAALPPGRGMGLVGMRERMLARGGTFTVRSRPGEGTHISATVPAAGRGPGPDLSK